MDYKELSKKVNKFREDNIGKTFTSSQLYPELEKMGFNVAIAKQVAALFPSTKVGTSKLYEMSDEPIHQLKIENIYNKAKKSHIKYKAKTRGERKAPLTEKAAIDLLQSKGYRIKRVVKFDMERFMKEQQEMYRRYCIYDYV